MAGPVDAQRRKRLVQESRPRVEARMNDPEWSDFKVILALGRSGSVAGAARALAVDHSTVSRRLAALEEILGASLVVRGGRDFCLTGEGRTAFEAAQAVEATLAAATRTIRSAKLEVAGAVSVSCPSGLVTILTRLLEPVLAKQPLLSIELSADNRTVDLARGEADIAIRMFRPTDTGLVARRAFELGWGAYASQGYLADHGTPATAAELPQHRLILYLEAMHRASGPRWLEDHKGTAKVALRADNTDTAGQAIASGTGIGVVPCVAASARPELIPVFPRQVATATGWLVYHETLRDSARVRAALAVLAELFETHAALFSGVPEQCP
jgi:DNA-binding transcriptional LysR family regulator